MQRKKRSRNPSAIAFALVALAATVGASAADYAATVSALGPVAYYRLNTTNPVPTEVPAVNVGSLGTDFNGEYRSMPDRGLPGALAGDSSTAIGVNGSQFVAVPFSADYNLASAFTIEAWLKPGSDAAGLTAPLNSGQMADPRSGWILYQNGADGWSFRMYNQNGLAVSLELVGGGPVSANVWYHFVATYDGTTARMYVDGVEAASGSPSGTPTVYVANTSGPFVIGGRSDFAFPWKGMADEVALYTTALSAADVLAHYQNGTNPSRPQPYPDLVKASNPAIYLRLDEPALQLPVAANTGSLGAIADGRYLPGTTSDVPSLQMPAVTGFETTNVAAGFNGTSGSVQIPGLNLYSDTVTMVCWLRRDGTQPARAGIMHNRKVTEPQVKATGLGFQDNGLALSYNWEDVGETYNFNPGFIPPDQMWTFYAVTIAPDQQVMFMGTANGLVAATNTFAILPHDFSGTTLELGWDNYQATRIFRGSLDEFAMFDKTLTPEEVASLYNAALPAILGVTRAPVDPVYEGMEVTFSTSVAGTAPITYQWRKGGNPITGQTGPTLTLSNVTTADSGDYDVVVTTGGQTLTSQASSLAVLTSPPQLLTVPTDAVRFLNGAARFTVTTRGSQPMSYQWKFGTTVLAGATSATLELTDLQPADAGEYTVVVSNPYGSQEASATLTLVTPTKYAAAAADAGPIGYWRLDETSGTTAYDYWGGRDGILTNGATVNAVGPRPSVQNGFDASNTGYEFPGNASAVAIPPLNLNKATATIVAWIKPSGDQVDYAGIVFARGATATGLDYTTEDQLGYHWNDTGDSYNWRSGLYPVADQWNFVALVVEPTQATMYLDEGSGLQSYGNAVTHGPAAFADPLRIGVDSPGGGRGFKGTIDEVTFYDRALSTAEITALRNAGFAGTYNPTPVTFTEQPKSQTILVGSTYTLSARAAGSLPLAYQWQKNGQDIPGAIRSSLTFDPAVEADTGTYRLVVTQGATQVNSAAATLTVKPVPTHVNLADNLVLHLKFDGTYQDSSGRNNHGTAQGSPQVVTGKIGSGALKYNTVVTDGAVTEANYVTLGTPADLAFGPGVSFSVAFWIKFTGSPGDLPFFGNTVYSYGDPGVNFAPSWEEGGWSWYISNAGASAWQGIGLYDPVKNTLNDGNWHSLVHIFDRAGEAMTYLDGVKVHTGSITGAASWDFNVAGQPWTIGQAGAGDYAVAGTFEIDDLGVWRRVLTDYDAQAIYIVGDGYGRSFDTTAPAEVRIEFETTAGGLELTWSSGTLESSDRVDSGYSTVAGASSPFTVAPGTTGNRFYRVRVQ